MIDIEEVLGPATQGCGGAYECRGADSKRYWVKGLNAQRAFQVREWIAGHLAKAFGLPIANFRLVNIDAGLHLYLPTEYQEIGYGACFASEHAENSTWLWQYSMPKDVPEQTQMDLLLFDFWIQNPDRTVGNPNLLWVEQAEQLVVIDHNLSFETDFCDKTFFEEHVFAHQKDNVFGDCAIIAEYSERMEKALTVWGDAIESIPEEWNWSNLEQDHPAEIDLLALRAVVDRFEQENFWSMK